MGHCDAHVGYGVMHQSSVSEAQKASDDHHGPYQCARRGSGGAGASKGVSQVRIAFFHYLYHISITSNLTLTLPSMKSIILDCLCSWHQSTVSFPSHQFSRSLRTVQANQQLAVQKLLLLELLRALLQVRVQTARPMATPIILLHYPSIFCLFAPRLNAALTS